MNIQAVESLHWRESAIGCAPSRATLLQRFKVFSGLWEC